MKIFFTTLFLLFFGCNHFDASLESPPDELLPRKLRVLPANSSFVPTALDEQKNFPVLSPDILNLIFTTASKDLEVKAAEQQKKFYEKPLQSTIPYVFSTAVGWEDVFIGEKSVQQGLALVQGRLPLEQLFRNKQPFDSELLAEWQREEAHCKRLRAHKALELAKISIDISALTQIFASYREEIAVIEELRQKIGQLVKIGRATKFQLHFFTQKLSDLATEEIRVRMLLDQRESVWQRETGETFSGNSLDFYTSESLQQNFALSGHPLLAEVEAKENILAAQLESLEAKPQWKYGPSLTLQVGSEVGVVSRGVLEAEYAPMSPGEKVYLRKLRQQYHAARWRVAIARQKLAEEVHQRLTTIQGERERSAEIAKNLLGRQQALADARKIWQKNRLTTQDFWIYLEKFYDGQRQLLRQRHQTARQHLELLWWQGKVFWQFS